MAAEAVKRKPVPTDELQKKIRDLSQQKIALGWKGMKEAEAQIDLELNELLKQRVMTSVPTPAREQKPVERNLPAMDNVSAGTQGTVSVSMAGGKAAYAQKEVPKLFLKQAPVPKYA